MQEIFFIDIVHIQLSVNPKQNNYLNAFYFLLQWQNTLSYSRPTDTKIHMHGVSMGLSPENHASIRPHLHHAHVPRTTSPRTQNKCARILWERGKRKCYLDFLSLSPPRTHSLAIEISNFWLRQCSWKHLILIFQHKYQNDELLQCLMKCSL